MNVLQMFDLHGKVAVVTGGSGNYGSQIVYALAEAGAKVYTASRNLEKNMEFAKKLCEKGFDVIGDSMDMASEQSIKDFADRVLTKDKVDILVNNSVLRIMGKGKDPYWEFSESMKVNATGLYMLTHLFAESMKEQKSGSIINIGSYMGMLGPDDTLYRGVGFSGFGGPDYFFHKAGMANLTRFFASYYGPDNVRCNVISLGGLFNNQGELFVNRYSDRTFLKRMANDTDLKGTIVFLASDASLYITGSVITVDGGYSAK